jgi:RimJ/RimL family protein N-acetyltransferase
MFSVIEKASGRWMGRLGPYQPEGWPGTEVGWSLHPEAWGRGYAREGASAAMDYAFDVLGWDEVIHCIIDPNNAPSQRVAIALGSQLRGPGRMPPPFDQAPCEIWGQTPRRGVACAPTLIAPQWLAASMRRDCKDRP